MAFKKKSSGAIAGNSTTSVALGATYARLIQMRAYGADASFDLTITDADGAIIFVGTALDGTGTVAVGDSLGMTTTGLTIFAYDGMDKAGVTVTDQSGGGPVVKSPLSLLTANNTGGVTIEFHVEV